MTARKMSAILVSGLALFAMFFGAGNLIFPTMIGIEAGETIVPAVFGFVLTGVFLPTLGILASATSSRGVRGINSRIGSHFSKFFTTVVFLSIGVFYAIPRVATVSYEMLCKPLLIDAGVKLEAGSLTAQLSLALFTLVFFGVTAWLALSPSTLVSRIGIFLTPALLILLAVLIVTGLIALPAHTVTALPEYATAPIAAGLLKGYSTMDALAAIVFGGIIIQSLRDEGFETRKSIFGSTVGAGLIAAISLAVVYVGLAALGARVANQKVANGAEALSNAAVLVFGSYGHLIFGLVVLLACLTTAIGLVGSSVEYFSAMFPQVSHPKMVAIHTVVALALSNLGLEIILQIVGPLTLFTYPITIALIAICIVDLIIGTLSKNADNDSDKEASGVISGWLNWTYKLPVWLAAVIGTWSSMRSLGLGKSGIAAQLWNYLPGSSIDMAWVAPCLLVAVVGIVIDIKLRGKATAQN